MPKRPKVEKAPQKKSIADHGREASNRKKKSTRDALIDAMREMEREIEKNNGLYPFAEDGFVNTQEVLRRAGKSSALLEKSHHKVAGGLKEDVTDWVMRVNGRITGGVRIVRKLIRQEVNEADDRVEAIKQAWTEAELEYIQAREDIVEKDKEITVLKLEISYLKAKLAGANVVQLRPTEREPS
ncbi:hypothetical protein BB934_01795 [Microvirga ossetica]|uniref:Uncharacterized protein n=1 Tax=Microvirga ossetica TaxID=1882682 RepID=A0A1B2EAV0_9HYPH|nr:hypothetical protein [Microvirga ossetica]ANY77105.1 hypothetical protein BB934_01795 [Microvirga ossetica]